MHFATLLLPLLAATGAHANGRGFTPTPADLANWEESYPLCPEDYETYCCLTAVPYSHRCRRRQCTNEYGWSCVGRGKVDSVRACLTEEENKTAYCKKPGEEYFPSLLRWNGGSFSAVIEPSDYRHWVRPGMHKPWTPKWDEIRYDDEVVTEEGSAYKDQEVAGELRKRDEKQGNHDMI